MGTFDQLVFEKKLLYLKDTHESIANLSSWCLSNQEHHHEIVSIWLSVLKKVKMEHRLLMFYLANDVIQYSRKKQLPFVESWAPALQKATTMVREDSVRNKILRLFKIWDERGIYDETFLVDLSGLLSRGHKPVNRIDIHDFQPSIMYSRIRSCKKLEDETDMKLKIITDSKLSLTDIEKMRSALKDRASTEEVVTEVDEGVRKIKDYIDALEVEIKERIGLIDLLEIGEQYYEKEMKEAKVVVNAYKCFGQRVRGVKRKLEERIGSLPSPVPSPDINAPSPSPEEDKEFELPDETFCNVTFSATGSFLERGLPGSESVSASGSSIPALEEPYTPSKYFIANESFSTPHFSAPTGLGYFFPGTNSAATTPAENAPLSQESEYSPTNQISSFDDPVMLDFVSQLTAKPPPLHKDGNVISNVLPVESENVSNSSSILPNVEGNKIEVISTKSYAKGSGSTSISVCAILQSLMSKGITVDTSLPLEPPPPPPTGLRIPDASLPPKFPTWDEPQEDISTWESPESPPSFEKTGFPASVVYDDRGASQDTDMRFKDVDHRNLISLTGTTTNNWSPTDTDYRDSLLHFPTQDNIENVDMDLSDDEDEKQDTDSVKLNSLNVEDIILPQPKSLNQRISNILNLSVSSLENSLITGLQSPSSILPGQNKNDNQNSPLQNLNGEVKCINKIHERNGFVSIPILSPSPPFSNGSESLNGLKDSFVANNFSSVKISQPLPPLPPPPPPPPPPQQPWTAHPPSYNQPPPPFEPQGPPFNQRPFFIQRAPPTPPRPYRPNFRPVFQKSPRYPRW